MFIHAIDIDHPPGIGIDDDMSPAAAIVYAQAATVTAVAMKMGDRAQRTRRP
jgi:hypothetical protein